MERITEEKGKEVAILPPQCGATYLLARVVMNGIWYLFGGICSAQGYIPEEGATVMACCHLSNWDPPFLNICVRRKRVYTLGKEELFDTPLKRWFIPRIAAFRVTRGTADRKAIRTAADILKDGDVLDLFPEGTRNKDGVISKFEEGLRLILSTAYRDTVQESGWTRPPHTGTITIVPTYIYYAKYPRRPRIYFGPPLIVDSKTDLRPVIAEIERRVRELQALHGPAK